ncbi:MAG: acyl-CoA synthetase [Ilumatobacter sp.]
MFDDALTSTIAGARGHTIGDLLRRSALRHPERPALLFGGRTRTYAELDDHVNRVANALTQRGVRQGDRIAMLSHNNDAFVIAYFALARLGAISVPINFMLNASEVAYVVDHSTATGVIVEDALALTMDHAIQQADHGGDVAMRISIGTEAGTALTDGWTSFDELLEHDDATEPDVAVGDDDPIQLMYTSGTESRPKGAIMTNRGLIAQYVSCIVDGGMSGNDVEIHSLPLYHCAQLHCFITPGIYLGAKNIVLAAPDPAVILETVERERATKLFCPPTVWISLLRHPDFDRRDLSSLRLGYYGASIMPVEVLRELIERLPNMALYNFYGQTEMAPVATILGPEDQVRKAGSAGRACLNVETRIVDDDDHPVPPGTVGEIVHRSPHATLGYWNAPDKTAESFRNGWFHSGDLGVFDDEGYLTIVDRKKDMIKSGGENVASREVEETLYRHPAVQEVAVFGVPDEKWIEAVTATVVVKPGESLTPDELIAFARGEMAGYKTPKHVVIVDELPKNASGKVLKRELRDAVDLS